MKKFENSTLFQALQISDAKRLQRFEEYLLNVVSKKDTVALLFSTIRPALFSNKKSFPNQAVLIDFLFSDKKGSVQHLRYAMSKLLSIYEDWLAIDFVLTNPVQRANLLAKSYGKLGFPAGVRRAEQQFEKEVARTGLRNDQMIVERYQINWALFNSGVHIPSAEVPAHIEGLIVALDKYFISRQMQQIGVRLAYGTISTGGNFDKEKLDYLLNMIDKEKHLLEEPCIKLYYMVVKMQLDPSDTGHFQAFVSGLYEHIHIFPATEARSLWIFAINYCLRNRNEGFASYHRVMELYDIGLKRNILTQNGKVTQTTFLNALKYGLKMNEVEAMELFLERYRDLLESSEAENTILESQARIAFAKKNYTHAIDYLKGVKHQSLLSELSLRLLQFRILYEMEDMDRLEKHLHSLSIFFLRRKKQLGYHQKSLNNYIKAATYLLKTNKYSKEERLGFQLFVKKLQPIFEREWFLQMSQ